MVSNEPPRSPPSPLRLVHLALLVACLAAARLPFLLRGETFFNADEAVEGLMALHVWQGELPVFFWGQDYKGVPEIYAMAVVFKIFGASVIGLKAVTLVIFAAFVAMTAALASRLESRAAGAIAAATLIAGAPSLVFWSLAGTAEVAITLLLGTALFRQAAAERPATVHFALGGLIAGLAVWVHAYAFFYLVPFALWTASRNRAHAYRGDRRFVQVLLLLGVSLTVTYLGLWLAAASGYGVEFDLGPLTITAHSTRKLSRLGLLFGAPTFLVWIAGVPRISSWRHAAAAAGGFLVGFAPALAGGIRWPGQTFNLARVTALMPDIARIVAGADAPDTGSSHLPVVLFVVPAMLVVAFVLWRDPVRHNLTDARRILPLLRLVLICGPVMFFASGAAIDPQSYRYLMPLYAVLPIAIAVSISRIAQHSLIAAVLLLANVLGVGIWAQWRWYERLVPLPAQRSVIADLAGAGVKGGYAGYWEAYPLTFLSGESLIVAPTGADRYPPYREAVDKLPAVAIITRDGDRLTFVVQSRAAPAR